MAHVTARLLTREAVARQSHMCRGARRLRGMSGGSCCDMVTFARPWGSGQGASGRPPPLPPGGAACRAPWEVSAGQGRRAGRGAVAIRSPTLQPRAEMRGEGARAGGASRTGPEKARAFAGALRRPRRARGGSGDVRR